MPKVVNNIQSLRVLSLLYSSPALKCMLHDNSLDSIKNKVAKHKHCLGSNELQFEHFLSDLYSNMVNDYCNEYVYKNTLLNKYILNKYSLENTTLLSEFKTGKSIADLILINGEVKLFEVKTELDTLQRLSTQLDEYKKVAEKIYLVTDTKYIEYLKFEHKDSNIGIIEFNKSELIIHKEAIEDKTHFDHQTIFKILRKNEYLDIIKTLFGYIPNVPNTLIFKECLEMACTVDVVKFQQLAFQKLKARSLKEPELLTSPNTPSHLRFLCHTLNMDRDEYHTLFNLLNEKL